MPAGVFEGFIVAAGAEVVVVIVLDVVEMDTAAIPGVGGKVPLLAPLMLVPGVSVYLGLAGIALAEGLVPREGRGPCDGAEEELATGLLLGVLTGWVSPGFIFGRAPFGMADI